VTWFCYSYYMKKLSIPILLGTNRKKSKSQYVAAFINEAVAARVDMGGRLFRVGDFQLPQDDYGQAIKEQFPEWRDAIVEADGLIIIVPEYNHGYPGSMKSVIDLLLREYVHKAVGLVGVSAGMFGGTRGIEAMVNMVRELGLAVTFTDLTFPKVGGTFDEGGVMKKENREIFDKLTNTFLDELAWMSTTLRWGRENVPSQYHKK
jgi:NAD(P)H-dependent FMN reductase